VNNVLVETDYPHADSSFPDNGDILDDRLRHLSADDRRSVLRTNAEKLFRFQPQMG
jgi:predicted TIM-barrel fold metal-dependent hydrolase